MAEAEGSRAGTPPSLPIELHQPPEPAVAPAAEARPNNRVVVADGKDIRPFLTEYLKVARDDVRLDKNNLTQLMFLKAGLVGGIAVLMQRERFEVLLSVLPIVLFVVDFIHRTRFNEGHDRWAYIAQVLAPALQRAYASTPSAAAVELHLFEVGVIEARHRAGRYKRQEASIRTVATVLSLLLGLLVLPAWCVCYMPAMPPEQVGLVATAGAASMFSAYYYLFLSRANRADYRGTYRPAHVMPVTIVAAVVVIWIDIAVNHAHILNWLGDILRRSSARGAA